MRKAPCISPARLRCKEPNTHPPRGGTYIVGQPPRNVKEEFTLTCTKQISMTGYLVRYVDLRGAKPRSTHEDVYVLEKDVLKALEALRMNVADFITARYERGGYHVISVERIQQKRTAEINLLKVWQCAAPTATEEQEADK